VKDKATFWMAVLAVILCVAAIVLRLLNPHGGDYFGLIGPAAIILLMVSIIARHRPGKDDA
jgi:hypothetical protein